VVVVEASAVAETMAAVAAVDTAVVVIAGSFFQSKADLAIRSALLF
jgi:hypothetical protein